MTFFFSVVVFLVWLAYGVLRILLGALSELSRQISYSNANKDTASRTASSNVAHSSEEHNLLELQPHKTPATQSRAKLQDMLIILLPFVVMLIIGVRLSQENSTESNNVATYKYNNHTLMINNDKETPTAEDDALNFDELEWAVSRAHSDSHDFEPSDERTAYLEEADRCSELKRTEGLTQEDIDQAVDRLSSLRTAAKAKTDEIYAEQQARTMDAIQGEWHGLRREWHEFEVDTWLANSPSHRNGEKEVIKSTSFTDQYDGVLRVEGNHIVNEGIEYHWSGNNDMNAIGVTHEIEAVKHLKTSDVVDSDFFYGEPGWDYDEPRDFTTRGYSMQFRLAEVETDMLMDRRRYDTLVENSFYLLKSTHGDERLVWVRVYRRDKAYERAWRGVPRRDVSYQTVKYVWTR